MASNNKNVWMVLGIGCGGVVLIAIAAVVGLGFLVKNTVEDIEATMKDPSEKALELLGAEELPTGYYPTMAMGVPFLFEMVIISDEPPHEDPNRRDLGDRGFIYMKMIRFGSESEELEQYFRGETQDPGVLRDTGINIDVDEELDRGVIEKDGNMIMYMTQRGRVAVNNGNRQGLSTVSLIRCGGERKVRFAIWYGPESENPDQIAGTAADVEAFQEFIGHFKFCE